MIITVFTLMQVFLVSLLSCIATILFFAKKDKIMLGDILRRALLPTLLSVALIAVKKGDFTPLFVVTDITSVIGYSILVGMFGSYIIEWAVSFIQSGGIERWVLLIVTKGRVNGGGGYGMRGRPSNFETGVPLEHKTDKNVSSEIHTKPEEDVERHPVNKFERR